MFNVFFARAAVHKARTIFSIQRRHISILPVIKTSHDASLHIELTQINIGYIHVCITKLRFHSYNMNRQTKYVTQWRRVKTSSTTCCGINGEIQVQADNIPV